MIDEKLDERIQKFAQSTRLNDAGRRAGFEGYQPTQSMADRQGEAPPVAQNVPPPPPRPAPPPIQTRADTNLPRFSNGSVSRDAGGLHTGRYVTQKDFDEGNAQVEAYKRAHPERTGYRPYVTSNRYRGDSWNRPPQTFAPSATASRQGAAQFRQAAQQPAQNAQPVNRIQQIDQRAEAEAKAQAEKREQARRNANVSVGEAFSEALRKFRDDSTAITRNGRERIVEKDANGNELRPGVNGYEAKYRDSANRYRIGMLQPSTIRALNQQRSSLGLKESDSIVGIYAVSGVDANGKQTGEPQIITNYRSADGRIHKKVYTYQEAARFVRGTMGDKGDASADDRFVSMKQWQDADGNDALGITRTAEYQERKAKLEAASLKNDLTRQQMEQGKTEFEQKQADRAEKKENEPVAKAQASAKEYRDFAAKVAKDNPELASQMLQVAAKFESDANREQGRINRRKEIDGLKKGDPIPSIPGARKKNDTGYDIEPMEGYEEKNGRFVRVKPQKPGAKPPTAQNTSSSTTETGGEANVHETQTVPGEGANESMPKAVNAGNEPNGSVVEPQNGNTPGNIAQQSKSLDIMGRLGRAIRSLGEGYQTGEAGSEPVMRYDIRSERNVQKRQDEQNYNKRVSSARLRRARQDAEDRARIERRNESNNALMQTLSKSQKERDAEWKERSRKITAIKDEEARKRLKKQEDEEKKKMMELYSSGDIDAIRREEQKVEELDALLEDVTK